MNMTPRDHATMYVLIDLDRQGLATPEQTAKARELWERYKTEREEIEKKEGTE